MTNKLSNIMKLQNNRIVTIMLAVTNLLLIPLIAMQFTEQVKWDLKDFTVMAFLLFTTGLLIDLLFSKVKYAKSRILLIAVVLTIFFLTWAELAVGIFGTPFAGN